MVCSEEEIAAGCIIRPPSTKDNVKMHKENRISFETTCYYMLLIIGYVLANNFTVKCDVLKTQYNVTLFD